MRPIDADTLKVLLIETLEQIARKPNMDSQEIHIIAATHVLCEMLDDAQTINVVPRDEHEMLLKRFRHLLESDFIKSFDEYDPKHQTYKRDIVEADKFAHVRHGCWKPIKVSIYPYGFDVKCSECGCAILGGVGGRGWNYCPNCGAKMEDEQ